MVYRIQYFIQQKQSINVDNFPPDAFESGQPGEGRVLVGYPVGQEYVVKFAGIAQQEEQIPVYDLNGR